MHRASRAAALALVLALAPPRGAAQGRPSEDDLFGGPAETPPRTQAAPMPSVGRERDDTLRIGGLIYLRGAFVAEEGQPPGEWRFASPNLVDVYLDTRPNDRVRGFVLGRLFYDPTILPEDPAAPLAATLQPQALAAGTTANPRAVLDQLWVNFDVERRAFVTVGKQHAKWGVGRFWNPTDYLHPVRRDPLATFDVRTGTYLVKVHVPWEARGWNLYAVAVFEDVAGDPPRRPDGTQDGTSRLGRIGGGGRAEVVLGPVELGADALLQGGHRPRFGVDFSAGVWDLDVYGEAALRTTVDTPRWREVPGTEGGAVLQLERHDPLGFTPQVVAGATWTVKYSDEDTVTFGAEYFFDDSGYANARVYPGLGAILALSPSPTFRVPSPVPGDPDQIFDNPIAGQPNPFTPFFLGRHYAGAYASLPAPGGWNDTSFTLSVIGNLSDRSYTARLDHSVLLLTYLRLETYFEGRFGARDGEFRLGMDTPFLVPGSPVVVPIRNDPRLFEAGIALRVSL